MKKPAQLLPKISSLTFAVALALHSQAGLTASGPSIKVDELDALMSTRSTGIDANGNAIVVWGGADGVRGRCYKPDGGPLAGAFDIDGTTTDQAPVVAMNGGGAFVVVWPSASGLRAQRYANCTAIGAPSAVSVSPTGGAPSVAMDADGHFTAAWEDGNGNVLAERFDGNGQPQNLAISLPGSTPSIAMDPTPAETEPNGGAFVIAAKSNTGISVKRFDAGGSESGAEITIDNGSIDKTQGNTSVTGTTTQSAPSVAMDGDGDFVIGWSRDTSGEKTVTTKVKNRRKCQIDDYTGKPYVDEYGHKNCYYVDAEGLETYDRYSQNTKTTYLEHSEILARRYDAAVNPKDKARNGTPKNLAVSGKGKNHVMNGAPSVAMDTSGNFAIGWSKETSRTIKGKCTPDPNYPNDPSYATCTDDVTQTFSDVLVQKYKAKGKPKGGIVNVSGQKDVVDDHAGVAMDDAGDLIVGWQNGPAEKTTKTLNVAKNCTGDPATGMSCYYYDASGNHVYDKYSYATETVTPAAVNAKLYVKKK